MTYMTMKAIKNILAGLAIAVASTAGYAYDMPAHLYLVGDGTPAGWKSGSPLPMVKEEGNRFTWEGNLYSSGARELKFLGQKDWGPVAIYAQANGTEITTDAEQSFTVVYGGDDNKWKVGQNGYYRLTLTLDPTKPESEAGTLTVNYLGESKPEIYMLGMVPDRWGNSSEGIAIFGENGIYSWTGDIYYYGDDKQLKFALTKGEWNAVTYLVPTEVNLNGDVQQVEPGTYAYQESREDNGGLKDWFWGIMQDKSGQYKVTVNTNDKTVNLELLKLYSFDKDNTTELYIQGLASNSFDSNNLTPMTSLGDGKFQWKGKLDYNTEDGESNHKNKQFKFVTRLADWDKTCYLVPASAESDGHIQELEPGEHDMKMTTWMDGHSGVDGYFGLKPNMSGNYILTADVPNMKVKLEEDTDTGVEAIAVETDGAGVAYDLNGMKVNLQNAPAGVYIVRKGGTASKVIIK